MKLNEIEKRISENIKDRSFFLCGKTTTDTEDIQELLTESIGTASIEMKDVTFNIDDELKLSGTVAIYGQSGVGLEVCFKQEDQESVKIRFKFIMPKDWNMPLDSGISLSITNVRREFERISNTKRITGELEGVLALYGMSFNTIGEYDQENQIWRYKFSSGEAFGVRNIVMAFGSIIMIDLPAKILPDIQIKSLVFEYDSKTEGGWDRLLLDITTGAGIFLSGDFGITNLGVVMQKRNSSYSFTLKGDLVIGSTHLPVIVRMRDSGFDIGVDTGDDGCLLPSLADVATVVGAGSLLSSFPAEIANRKALKLMALTASAPLTLGSLSRFSVGVATADEWSFFGIPGISLARIYFGFNRQVNGDTSSYELAIAGDIKISGFTICLGAMYDSESGWVFNGCFPPGEKLNLSDIVVALAGMLNLDMQALPIPVIELSSVKVSFGLSNKSFEAGATISAHPKPSGNILEKLFNISATVNISSLQQNGKRSYAGDFSGTLIIAENVFIVSYKFDNLTKANTVNVKWALSEEGKPLTLSGILSAFGVNDIPPVVEVLDVGITSVEMEYKIDRKELSITIGSPKFDNISLVVSDSDYEADIRLKDKISLSMLPVVGTSLHLLDALAIENLELLASSKDHEELGTLSGAALLGKIKEEPFVLQLYHPEKQLVSDSNDGGSDLSKWFNINKSFGIFQLHRFGIGFKDGKIAFLLDASLSAKPVGLSLLGLGLGVSLSDPKDIGFYLSGLGIDFDNGTIGLSGAFMKSTLGEKECYDGKLMIKMKDFSLFAMGVYSGDSLLVYALLNMQIGGPPIFFVTGISAGFAINMKVKLPSIDEVPSFPLVSAALGKTDKESMLTKLKENISYSKGQTFLAVGVKFTSFKMVESFALLTVTFGNYTEIGLLGLSEISVPSNLPKNTTPIAFAQLAIKAVFSPEEGLFSLMAKLTSESYILSKNCLLRGGFAFYIWFADEHSGDFVVTLGGYHPSYVKPAHYPDVPRLGFNWKVTKELSLDGDLYFALTPSSLMAGGRLSAVYDKSPVKAWFIAKADFYISWKPFHYDIDIYVGLGVAVKVDFLFIHTTIKLELSAGIHIWGPEFSGTATISLYIISFTISFGAGASPPPDLDWKEFKDSFLPKSNTAKKNPLEAGLSDTEEPTAPVSIAITNGMRGEETVNGAQNPVACSDSLELLIKSSVPSTKIIVNDKEARLDNTPMIGVLPMGKEKKLSSELSVTVKNAKGIKIPFKCEAVYGNLPGAMWRYTKTGEELVNNAAVGVRICPVQTEFPFFPENGFIDLEQLSVYSTVNREFYWNPSWKLPDHPQNDPIGTFSATLMQGSVKTARANLIKCFNEKGFSFDTDLSLTKLADDADNVFCEEMLLGVII